MKLGILGKPQSGKTTIFNAASGMQETVGNFSQATHRSVVKVPDNRLAALAEIVFPKKITPAEIEFVDTPGLTGMGKSSGSLEISADLRQSDAFMLVVDSFSPGAKPRADLQSLLDEMLLLDQAMLESAIERKTKKLRMTGDKSEQAELDLLKKLLQSVEIEKLLIDMGLTDSETKLIRGYQFLTLKPLLIVVNVSEELLPKAEAIQKEFAELSNSGRREVVTVCGKVESEIAALDPAERSDFLAEIGITAPAVEKVIQKSYELLGLISFLTAGEPEVRAWTIRQGTNAQKAAGTIHSDLERGFIRAEVVSFGDYVQHRTIAALKSVGKMRLEGKEYVVQDGDVILFRFNV